MSSLECVMLLIINILGGLPIPDGGVAVQGKLYDLDPLEPWVRAAVRRRHLIPADSRGHPVHRAPEPHSDDLPCDLGQKVDWPVESMDDINDWMNEILFG